MKKCKGDLGQLTAIPEATRSMVILFVFPLYRPLTTRKHHPMFLRSHVNYKNVYVPSALLQWLNAKSALIFNAMHPPSHGINEY